MLILAVAGKEAPVSSADADSFELTLAILTPLPGEVIRRETTGALIRIEWEHRGDTCWVQYEIGKGEQTITGMFRANSNPLVVGPFPDAFWNDLATHNPFRFRIVCKDSKEVSPWTEFTLASVSP